jgi:hypothetical protein
VTEAVLPESIDERSLRHPLEVPYFITAVIVNFALLAGALVLLFIHPDWLKHHPFIAKQVGLLRDLIVAGLVGLPAVSLARSIRRARMLATAVEASADQFPSMCAILEKHCRALGVTKIPELFIADRVNPPYSVAGSDWQSDYIVLGEAALETDLDQSLDIAAFFLGYELGRIRLHHTALWNELLLAYIEAVPYLANPLRHVRTYSRDRYGAALAKGKIRGLLLFAANRRLLVDVNASAFIRHALGVHGFWVNVAALQEPAPPLAFRLQELNKRWMALQGGIEPRSKELDT